MMHLYSGSKLVVRFKVQIIVFLMLSLLIIIYGLRPKKMMMRRIEEYSQTKSPPIVTEILGGLGNQLFQYAAAYSIAKKRNSDVYICVNGDDITKKAVIPFYHSSKERRYALDQFNVPQDKLMYLNMSYNFKWSVFDEAQCGLDYYLNGKKVENYMVTEVNVLKGDLPGDKVILIKDLFESDVFFAHDRADILNIFQPTFDTQPIEHLIKLVSSTENSVSVHIRRGDFSQKNDFRLISLSYQREAMSLIQRNLQTTNVTFFVFTDDLDYVKKHLEEGSDEHHHVIYMSEFTDGNTLYDFLLMSLCQHNIITNSTFSWWAAYLNKNPDKIVVAPLPKYRSDWITVHYPSEHSKSLLGELAYPKEWLTIEPTFLQYPDQRS